MKKINIITLFIFICCLFYTCFSFGQSWKQKGYFSLSLGYVPANNSFCYLSGNLTAGRGIGRGFLEYNQIITLSSDQYAPKLFQVRTGARFELDRYLEIRPFVGYSLTSVPKNESKVIGQGICLGAYMLQEVPNSEIWIKYELSVNNRCLVIPSIGMVAKF